MKCQERPSWVVKCVKTVWRRGLRLGPRWGSLQRSPIDPPTWWGGGCSPDFDQSATERGLSSLELFRRRLRLVFPAIDNNRTMFMVLSSWQSHCESLAGSFDECNYSARKLILIIPLTMYCDSHHFENCSLTYLFCAQQDKKFRCNFRLGCVVSDRWQVFCYELITNLLNWRQMLRRRHLKTCETADAATRVIRFSQLQTTRRRRGELIYAYKIYRLQTRCVGYDH